MKFIWEAEDIKVGRKIKLPPANEIWMIGYLYMPEKVFCLISINDGLVNIYTDVEDILNVLNIGYIPLEFINE